MSGQHILLAAAISYASGGVRCQYVAVSVPTRVYGGRSADDRRADRRERLVLAALDIWGEQGWAAVSMRGVCAAAGLTDRYFYESFADRDSLLLAVWDETFAGVIASTMSAMSTAPPEPRAQVRAALAAVIHIVAEDPRKARIGFGEHAGSAVLENRRHEAIQTFATLMSDRSRDWRGVAAVDDTTLRVNALIAVGGMAELVTSWLAGAVPLGVEDLIDRATDAAVPLIAGERRSAG